MFEKVGMNGIPTENLAGTPFDAFLIKPRLILPFLDFVFALASETSRT